MTPPPDPLGDGIAAFGRRLRAGETTVESATAAYLERIAALEPHIGAYEYIAGDQALAAARALDELLRAGTDLGPLMGVPVALKDLIAADGMPVTAGSNIDVAALIGPEGSFVKSLRRAGCVILGKTRTIEFAFGGAGGVNTVRGSPWNPWDGEVHRGCGGSSSGSAAAVAAGLSGFAIGSDAGGSVRLPAAFCGLFGLKPTTGPWPTDGVFPLCSTLDTIGPLTRTAADGAIVFAALSDTAPAASAPLDGLRLGRPVNQFTDPLEPDVEAAFEAALKTLRARGVDIVDVTVPEAGPPEAFFHAIVPAEFLASFGRDRFHAERHLMGADIAQRAAAGLDMTADTYVTFQRRHQSLKVAAAEAMGGFDGWITPTVGLTAPRVDAFDDVESGMALAVRIGRLTRPVNLYGLCAASLPIRSPLSPLPVGFQVMAPEHGDRGLLAMCMSLEGALETPDRTAPGRVPTA